MKVNVLSATKQEFNGTRYYLCGQYFQRQGSRLHIAVWKHHNGEIPKGYLVHHKDEDRSNNQIENLELMLGNMHISMHGKERDEYNQRHIKDIRELASEWHGSEEGRKWHGVHAKKVWEKKQVREYKCTFCGKSFSTLHDYGENDNTFCSNNCKSRFRAKSGLDNTERACAYCGKSFIVNKYADTQCCSRECAAKKRWGK